MWKVLLVISAVVLAGAAYLSYDNMGALKVTLEERDAQQALLEQRKESLEETELEIAQLEQSVQALEDEAETLQTEKINLDSKIVEAQSNLKAQETNLASDKESLESARLLITDIQKVEALQKEMIQIRTQIEESEIELTQLEGAVVAAQVNRDRSQKVAAELAALRVDQEAGLIRGEFNASIKRAYNQWGFVVISGGNDQGVVNRAQLDVYRRGVPVCKLLVTSVEPTESAADLIPGSLAPGQTVQEGDTVVKTIRAQTPAIIPAGQPAAPAPAQPAAAAPAPAPAATDPFGGSAPAAAPDAAPDPFGGSDAPAPAAGGAPDPFGGSTDAPTAGGAPDPFQ